MKRNKRQIVQPGMWFLITIALPYFQIGSTALRAVPAQTAQNQPSTAFTVRTCDGLELPAKLTQPSGPYKKTVVFVQGSTPYDEHGFEGPFWDENGKVVRQKNDFYHRFLDIMPAKGYAVVTMAKRSFVYPHRLPRPSLDELALDIQSLILELKKKELLQKESDLVIVGYSEGSIVASKLLGLLKKQPSACVLLGSASLAFNYHTESWRDWYRTDFYREKKNWTDEQIQTEFREFGSAMTKLLDMDEETFENEYKDSKPFGFGFAPWESYHIDKEVLFYEPTANLLSANIPTLICLGMDDSAMPVALAKRTHDRLVENGFEKATFRVIAGEVHQYRKYDVFAIMDAWLGSNGATTEYALTPVDSALIDKYGKIDEINNMISSLSWEGGNPEKALDCFARAKAEQYQESHPWFKLGIILFADTLYQQALFAFSQALDTTYVVRFAPMVWMGHIKDLQNNREEALEWYGKALEAYPGFPVQHSQWDMVIDRKWIQERIRTPFTGVVKVQNSGVE